MRQVFFKIWVLLFGLVTCNSQAQNTSNKTTSDHYLEDQLYVGLTYNILDQLPRSIDQSGFSNSIFLGYIKDLPVNKQRNFGFGLGLGYSRETYFQNLKITNTNGQTTFQNFQPDESFSNNKFVFHSIEAPIELRIRTSSINNYKFWRLYTGIKFKYIIHSRASFKGDNAQKVTDIDQLDRFNYGLTAGAGYGTWNVYFYYGLKPIFKDAYLNDTKINMKELKLGLIFYIL